eukprot:jgi/Mesen1/10065/ME000730S09349
MGSSGLVFQEDADIAEVLFTEVDIRKRTRELGDEISKHFKGLPLVAIGVATGAFMFLADLVRTISVPVEIDLIRAQSYAHGATETSGSVQLSSTGMKVDVRGKHVLLVEDILDTGRTLARLVQHLASLGPASVSVCVLLDKPSRRQVAIALPEGGRLYAGFECQDLFVVGYGLDFAERYRSLPYVGVLKPELYKHIL